LILSGTPFLAYFTAQTSITDPTAYLFAHFQVSNLVSALLVSSNPTNLVLTSAFGLSFLQYSAWLALPTIASVVVLFPLLRWLILRGRIPRVLEVPDEDTRREMGKLKDAWGGIFGSFLFLVTIALLVGLSAGGKLEGKEGVWTVTAPAALIMLTRDVVYDLRHRNQEDVGKNNIKEKEHGGIDNERDSPHGENGAQGIIDNPAVSGEKSNRPIDSTTAVPGQTESTPPHLAIPLLRPLQTRLPTT
jgi:Na+/H+ antiporter NhaD/arsenite permease-like protein